MAEVDNKLPPYRKIEEIEQGLGRGTKVTWATKKIACEWDEWLLRLYKRLKAIFKREG